MRTSVARRRAAATPGGVAAARGIVAAVIVRRCAGSWLVVRQADHARLAGEIVALMRLPELESHPRRRALLRAVAEHDNGWWEEDAAPRLDPATGGPLDFRSLPAAERRVVWIRGVERYAGDDPYVAALVAGHLLRLATALGEPSAGLLRNELDARRRELLARAGIELGEAQRDDRWLELGDVCSLALATGERAFLAAHGESVLLRELAGRNELVLDPFPFAGATSFALPARRLAAYPYSDAVALGLALAAAPDEPLALRVVAR